ncbi:TonB-dependent receptor [Arenimonas fontis]|uniref:TonB-dependent siderophore receptor n=1 Tax=Arenimonas fontis TaxID=2608255 RepID=A0A5B2ZCU2_9GAMM|nr:TonB-dependent siderophore receptor [Arenimonas fontis]KAA2285014.1 TonB-dependent siderophore receptor [Arenimonas fontis]
MDRTAPFLAAAPLAVAIATCLAALPAHADTAVDQSETPAAAQRAAADAERVEAADGTEYLPAVEVVGKAEYHYVERNISSATRTDTPLLDVPQSITVVTGDLIDDTAMRGLADVVQYVPGAGMAQGEGHRDAPVLRGNTSTADLFVNGMRDDVQYFRDLYNVERVEVLKGPNAMIFGRGGTGGVINRVTKQADWEADSEVTLQLGSWNRRRLTADVGEGVNDNVAFRVTALYEDSESFRDAFGLERWGVNPSLAFRIGENTVIHADVEHFQDERTTDRGLPSYADPFGGRRLPVEVGRSVFFGDPDNSMADFEVNAFNLLIEHGFGDGALLRNRTRWADYDKFYQNVYPGGPARFNSTTGEFEVAISAYNSATKRENLLNQTDLLFDFATGAVEHRLLAGLEFGRQESDNRRLTGLFPGNTCYGAVTTSSFCVPLSNPRYSGPVTFFQSATDADNRVVANVAAAYLQDQIEFSPQWQAVLGLRYDRFEVDFHNRRNGTNITTEDNLWSPRAGLIYKPDEQVSLYASYGLTYLPRSGEQMSSLTPSNAAFDPEEYENREIGAKWDIRPDLSLTAALYRLERSNVIAPDPADPTRSILVDGERIKGVEIGLAGNITEAWRVMGAYAWQDGEILTGADRGNRPANLPEETASLWNRYDFNTTWGVGLGVIYRGEFFAQTNNAVTLKSFTRYDAALYYTPSERVEVQLNVENLFDKRYFVSAHNDNNLSPGSPRAAYVSLTLNF